MPAGRRCPQASSSPKGGNAALGFSLENLRRGQVSGSTPYTLANKPCLPLPCGHEDALPCGHLRPAGMKTPGGHRHAYFCSFSSRLHSHFSSVITSSASTLSRCFSFHPCGASLTQKSFCSQWPRVFEEYRPDLRIYCLFLGGICCVTSAMNCKESKSLKFSPK